MVSFGSGDAGRIGEGSKEMALVEVLAVGCCSTLLLLLGREARGASSSESSSPISPILLGEVVKCVSKCHFRRSIYRQ